MQQVIAAVEKLQKTVFTNTSFLNFNKVNVRDRSFPAAAMTCCARLQRKKKKDDFSKQNQHQESASYLNDSQKDGFIITLQLLRFLKPFKAKFLYPAHHL